VLELAALQLSSEIDLDGVPHCPACLLELAWAIIDGPKPSHGLISRTTDWVWSEGGEAVRALVVQARMEERPGAEAALRDLELNGFRGRFAEAVVLRLANQLADEIRAMRR
jgi:hypothetical protein